MARASDTLADLLLEIREREGFSSWEQLAEHLQVPDVGTLYRWRAKGTLGPATAERLDRLGHPEFRRYVTRKVQPVRDDERRELAAAVSRIETRLEALEAEARQEAEAIGAALHSLSVALEQVARTQNSIHERVEALLAQSAPAPRRRGSSRG